MGVLDYERSTKFWLVQILTSDERVLDENNRPVINKGLRPDGMIALKKIFS